jgi:hypothetical protein
MPLPERSKSIKEMKPFGDECSFDRTKKKITCPHMRVKRIRIYPEITIVCPLPHSLIFRERVLGHEYDTVITRKSETARSAEKHRLLPPLVPYPRGNTPSTPSSFTYSADIDHNGS